MEALREKRFFGLAFRAARPLVPGRRAGGAGEAEPGKTQGKTIGKPWQNGETQGKNIEKWRNPKKNGSLPCGKRLPDYGKSQLLMRKAHYFTGHVQ